MRIAATPSVAVLLGVALGACAPRSGWVRRGGACQSGDPPRVCFDAAPDAPLTLRVGGETLVPGECAHAPKAAVASLRVEVVDGRTGDALGRRITVGVGRSATVTAVETVDGIVFDAERDRCTAGRDQA